MGHVSPASSTLCRNLNKGADSQIELSLDLGAVASLMVDGSNTFYSSVWSVCSGWPLVSRN